jgi:hypothetical protein
MPVSNAATAQQNEQPSGHPGRKPADKFHEGPVHVSIWENDGPRGAFRTVSHSYGTTDLKHLETAAKEARTRIEQWQQANKASQDNLPLT